MTKLYLLASLALVLNVILIADPIAADSWFSWRSNSKASPDSNGPETNRPETNGPETNDKDQAQRTLVSPTTSSTGVDGQVCNFTCPVRSRPQPGLSCISTEADCECIAKYTMHEGKCVKVCDFKCPPNSAAFGLNWCVQSFDDCVCEENHYKNKGQCIKAPPGVSVPSPYECGEWDMPSASPTIFCDFVCPDKSSPVEGRTCLRTAADCQCWPLYVMESGECVPTCAFQCPANSVVAPNSTCVMSFDDCLCSPHYTKKEGKCTPACDFTCPPFSSAGNSTCVMSLDDCTCSDHYMKKDDKCVPACDYQCPANSTVAANSTCVMSIDDCTCAPHFQKQGEKCLPACDYQCPANSAAKPGQCVMSFNDCSCLPNYSKTSLANSSACSSAAKLVNASVMSGQLGYPLSNPVRIISQTGSTLKFQIDQTWKTGSTISWIAVNYAAVGSTSANTCVKTENVASSTATFEAQCAGGTATIAVYVHDGSFKDVPNIAVPAICNPSADVEKKVSLFYSVPCLSMSSPSCTGNSTAPAVVAPMNQCVPLCDFQCPANSSPGSNVTCVMGINDCSCAPYYKKNDTQCVPACNFACPANSTPNSTCPMSFNDCVCGANYVKLNNTCILPPPPAPTPGKKPSSFRSTNQTVTCVASATGDPHVVTFDGFKFDCQAEGEMVLLMSKTGSFQIQARFTPVLTVNWRPTVTTGVLVVDDGYPPVQFSLAQVFNSMTTMLNGCPVNFFVNGNQRAFSSGSGIANVLVVQENSKTVSMFYSDTGVRLSATANTWQNTCYLDVTYKVPCSDDFLGLLGTPNGNPYDEWVMRDGTVLEQPTDNTLSQQAFQYCTRTWCINFPSQSFFTYEAGTQFSDFARCTSAYDPALAAAVANAPPALVTQCRGDTACIIDGLALGAGAAAATAKEQNELEDELHQVGSCPYMHLDFAGLGAGQYITGQLVDKYGVVISATGGFTNNQGAARIFDTSNPGTVTQLGSPNAGCPAGGPGMGDGGSPTSGATSNCAPLGMVLIVQDTNSTFPDDNAKGGVITFDFMQPAMVMDIAILSIAQGDTVTVFAVTEDGKTSQFSTQVTGVNGVYLLTMKINRVVSMRVQFSGSGAVAYVDYYLCPCNFQCPPNSKTSIGSTCIQNYGDCTCALPFKMQAGQCVNAWEITGPFTIETNARFDNITNGTKWQRVFDFGNGPGKDTIALSQCDVPTDMCLQIWVAGKQYMGRATGVLTQGTTDKWRVGVTSTGMTWIEKNGAQVKSFFGIIPANVPRTNKLIGASGWSDPPLQGAVLGMSVTNLGQKTDSTWMNIPDQIVGSFSVSVYARFDTVSVRSWQRIFEFGDVTGKDNIFLTQNANTSDLSLHVFKNGQEYMVKASKAIQLGVMSQFRCGVDVNGTMWIEKDDTRLVQGAGAVPANVVRSVNLVGASIDGKYLLDGAVMGLRVVNNNCAFKCPVNSQPAPFTTCLQSIDDCVCNVNYQKQGTKCVPLACTFACPANSAPAPGSTCIRSFADCQCAAPFYIPKGDSCVHKWEITGPTTISTTVIFNNLIAKGRQLAFDFGNGPNQDNVALGQCSPNSSDMCFTVTKAGTPYVVRAPGAIQANSADVWRVGVTADATMWMEKNKRRLAQGVGAIPANFTRQNKLIGLSSVATDSALDGAVLGLTVLNDNDLPSNLLANTPDQIYGAVAIEAYAQFDNLTSRSWQRVFDFANGAGLDNFVCGQDSNTNSMKMEIWISATGKQFSLTAAGAIQQGVMSKWKCAVASNGTMWIERDDKILVTGQGAPPSEVQRSKNLVGQNNWGSSYALDGFVLGLNVKNLVCNYPCPNNSSPIAGLSCVQNFNDCACDANYGKLFKQCVPASCAFQCPDYSTPSVGKTCIASADDCDCLPMYEKQGGACIQSLAITGPFVVTVSARFDSINSFNGGQTIFEFSNGPGVDTVSLGQCGNTTDLCFTVANSTVVAKGAIVAATPGNPDAWRVGVDPNGTQWIEKNSKRLIASPGVIPGNVTRSVQLFGSSSNNKDFPLIGAVQGLGVTNFGQPTSDRWTNVRAQIKGSFVVEAYVRFDNLKQSTWQRIFDFGNGAGKDNIVCGQDGSSSNINMQIFIGGNSKGLSTNGGIVEGELARWRCGIFDNATMFIEKNGVRLATGPGWLPASNVTRSNNLIGINQWGSQAYVFQGLIAGLRVSKP